MEQNIQNTLGKACKIKFNDSLYAFGLRESDSFLICQEDINANDKSILVRPISTNYPFEPVRSVSRGLLDLDTIRSLNFEERKRLELKKPVLIS